MLSRRKERFAPCRVVNLRCQGFMHKKKIQHEKGYESRPRFSAWKGLLFPQVALWLHVCLADYRPWQCYFCKLCSYRPVIFPILCFVRLGSSVCLVRSEKLMVWKWQRHRAQCSLDSISNSLISELLNVFILQRIRIVQTYLILTFTTNLFYFSFRFNLPTLLICPCMIHRCFLN